MRGSRYSRTVESRYSRHPSGRKAYARRQKSAKAEELKGVVGRIVGRLRPDLTEDQRTLVATRIAADIRPQEKMLNSRDLRLTRFAVKRLIREDPRRVRLRRVRLKAE